MKRRNQGKILCDEGVVRVNGTVVKASKEIKVGDVVEIDTVNRFLKFRIEEVPSRKTVSKKKAKELISVLEDRRKSISDIIDLI
ncbi:S4 domain-containing protein [Desulfurobacterium atlanticum]|uniref:S4 domain-containing protein n=1 Tax=Desulfurobacterium atlanticum TaxID=240169 RepID=UPI001FE38E22|nr:S4 domain-containing protein [Desulfurobacterium atlanticum]